MKTDPQKYIQNIQNRVLPYSVKILTANITIDNFHVYPPGKLAVFLQIL